MKKAFLIFYGACILSIAVSAQSSEPQERDKPSETREDAKRTRKAAQDSTDNISSQDLSNKNKVESDADSAGSATHQNEPVKPKSKRNLPGKRSQNDEDETGKNGGRTDRDGPVRPE